MLAASCPLRLRAGVGLLLRGATSQPISGFSTATHSGNRSAEATPSRINPGRSSSNPHSRWVDVADDVLHYAWRGNTESSRAGRSVRSDMSVLEEVCTSNPYVDARWSRVSAARRNTHEELSHAGGKWPVTRAGREGNPGFSGEASMSRRERKMKRAELELMSLADNFEFTTRIDPGALQNHLGSGPM
eukprot:COSAG05_NODE_3425_length_2075_cov_2.967105_2_plen_188_part_00